jgi:hypothetical protein
MVGSRSGLRPTVVGGFWWCTTGLILLRFRALDPRIEYLHTATRGNDFGVTPRLEALSYAVQKNSPDYAVFWDDDDYFWPVQPCATGADDRTSRH